ncbi:MAG: nucleotide exchange factor GrpE [Pseudomonadota bacterium]
MTDQAEEHKDVTDETADDANEVATETAAKADDDIAALQAKADENWDRYLRTAAELENVRKRATRDVENARKFALENFARELLGVVDSFEMGLAAADSADAQSLLEGSQATLKQLQQALERFQVSAVNPEGEPFDPELHEAISMQPSADMEPGSVLAVVQKGYTLNGRLLRAARVVVSTEAE